MSQYIISMTTDNMLRVLQRISSTFSRNRVNIEQLNVFETKTKNISHFNVAINVDKSTLERLLKQLNKIIECRDIHVQSIVLMGTKQFQSTTTKEVV